MSSQEVDDFVARAERMGEAFRASYEREERLLSERKRLCKERCDKEKAECQAHCEKVEKEGEAQRQALLAGFPTRMDEDDLLLLAPTMRALKTGSPVLLPFVADEMSEDWFVSDSDEEDESKYPTRDMFNGRLVDLGYVEIPVTFNYVTHRRCSDDPECEVDKDFPFDLKSPVFDLINHSGRTDRIKDCFTGDEAAFKDTFMFPDISMKEFKGFLLQFAGKTNPRELTDHEFYMECDGGYGHDEVKIIFSLARLRQPERAKAAKRSRESDKDESPRPAKTNRTK